MQKFCLTLTISEASAIRIKQANLNQSQKEPYFQVQSNSEAPLVISATKAGRLLLTVFSIRTTMAAVTAIAALEIGTSEIERQGDARAAIEPNSLPLMLAVHKCVVPP